VRPCRTLRWYSRERAALRPTFPPRLQGPIVEFLEQLTNDGKQWQMKVAIEDVETQERREFKLASQVRGIRESRGRI